MSLINLQKCGLPAKFQILDIIVKQTLFALEIMKNTDEFILHNALASTEQTLAVYIIFYKNKNNNTRALIGQSCVCILACANQI